MSGDMSPELPYGGDFVSRDHMVVENLLSSCFLLDLFWGHRCQFAIGFLISRGIIGFKMNLR